MKKNMVKYLFLILALAITTLSSKQDAVVGQTLGKLQSTSRNEKSFEYQANKLIEVKSQTLAVVSPTLSYTIRLMGTASKIYSSGESVEVEIITDSQGTLESYLSSTSIPISAGVNNYKIGAITEPGLYFLRFKASDGSLITNGLLIFPASPGKFTTEIIPEKLKVNEVASQDKAAFLKFINLIDGARVSAAWKKALPGWIAQNIATVGQAAVFCGVSTLGTAGTGAIVGCVVPAAGIMADATATVFAQVADDLKKAGKLTESEVISIKRAINLFNGAVQVVTSIGWFDRVASTLQGAASVIVDQTDKAQITVKALGDGIKKYNFIMQFKPKTL